MKSVFAITLIVLLATLPAQCRIGETLDQFASQYGPAKKDSEALRMPGHDQFSFEKDGLVIECVLTDGKCIMEVFHRRGPKISEQDVTELLKSEGEGHAWAFNKPTNRWLRSDHKLQAYRAPGHDDFFFIEQIPDKAVANHSETPAKDSIAALTNLPPAMSWQGVVVHPSWVIAADKEHVVFGTTERREISVPLAAVPENVAKRFETEIRTTQQKDADAALKQRLKETGAAGIFGRVLRKTEYGVLVTCGAPDREARFDMAGGGEAVPHDRITMAGEPGTVVLLRYLPNEAALVDNDPVSVVGYVLGTWQYSSAPGVIKTVRVYSAAPLQGTSPPTTPSPAK